MIKTTVKVGGMMCPHCEKRMNKAIANNFTVSEVTSSAKDNVTVIVSGEALNETVLAQTVNGLGFTYGGATTEEC